MTEFERECGEIARLGLKDNPLRREYEEKVAALKDLPPRLFARGLGEEDVARILHEKRRALGRRYKLAAPPLFRAYIYAATREKYGDPLGPGYEALRQRKSCAEIIASASRPIENLDDRLTLEGFRRWYAAHGME